MVISRRTLLSATGASALATGFGIGRSVAAEHTLRFANNLPPAHPLNLRLKEAADAIKSETGGKVEILIFPSSQLGSDTDMLSQIRSGAVQFFTLSGLILSTLVPAASINGVGFAFKNYDDVWKAMDGDLGAWVRKQIQGAGLEVMDKIWDNGFRQITSSNKPIATPGDLKNFKIRVPVSPMWTSMFNAFGSSPTSINFAETYTALQTKVVDGQENPLAIVDTAKLYEVQSYCSLTNHMWDGFWLLANRRAFSRLPQDVQTIVSKHFNEAAVKQRADIVMLNAHVQEDLTKRGMKFNEPQAAPFREALQKAGFYAEWKKKYGDEAWALLEKSVGSLA
jgi:tripartite ATP-independent transporter DctP family solute receptor